MSKKGKEEYHWSCNLNGTNKECNWEPPTSQHRLQLLTADLMPTAKKDEVTVVQLEIEGYDKEKVTTVAII